MRDRFSPGRALVLVAIAVPVFLLYCLASVGPVPAMIHGSFARMYAGAGRHDDAIAQYSVALQIMREYARKTGVGRMSGQDARLVKGFYFGRASQHLMQQDIAASDRDYAAVLVRAAGSDTAASRELNSRAAFHLAENAQARKDIVAVEHYLKMALVLDSGNTQAQDMLGTFYLGRGDIPLARFWFERSLKISPGFGAAWDNLKTLGFRE